MALSLTGVIRGDASQPGPATGRVAKCPEACPHGLHGHAHRRPLLAPARRTYGTRHPGIGGLMLRTTSARLVIGVAALVAIGGGTASSQSAAPAVSFTYMTFVDKATDQVGACIDEYTAKHPNVT